MRIRTAHIIIFLLLHAMAWGQAKLNIRADQRVFITGEDLWFDGIATGMPDNIRTVVVRLVDRNGTLRMELEATRDRNSFSGYFSVPENLPSDYYFLDCYAPGINSSTVLSPVMVINPRIAPVPCNADLPSTTLNTAGQLTDKKAFNIREQVSVSVSAGSDVSVVRYDKLFVLAESAAADFNRMVEHSEKGNISGEGHSLSVRATNGGAPVAGLKLVAGIKGSQAVISPSVTDGNGVAVFLFPLIYGNKEIVFTPLPQKGQRADLELLRYQLSNVKIDFPCLKLTEDMKPDIEARMLNSSLSRRYYGGTPKSYELSEADTTDFYGRPDHRYLLDEYVRFPVVEEVLLEIIPPVRVRKEGGDPIFQVLNTPVRYFFDEQGLVLVDGVPVLNAKDVMDADPLLFRTIDVMARKYIMGPFEFNGVVHFKSYKGDMANIRTSPGTLAVQFTGLQEKVVFQAPEFGVNSRLPDMRNTIVHDKAAKAGKYTFYTTDAEGAYLIRVYDPTASGGLQPRSSIIEVKAN